MKSFRIVVQLAAALAIIALAIPTPSLAATNTSLAPSAVTNVPGYGVTVGDVNSLAVQDQSGTQDTPANYVQLQPLAKKPYRADYTFTLPGAIHRYTVQGIQVQANYRGQLPKQQSWTYFVFNWRTGKWTKIGKAAGITSAVTWTPISLPVKYKRSMSDFVDPATRHILIQVRASNPKYTAALDSLAVVITSPEAVAAPSIGGCDIFDTNNVWNARVDMLPVAKGSSKFVASIGKTTGLHPDFGAGEYVGQYGIPYNAADNTTPTYTLDQDNFDYWDESDFGQYPIANDVLQEEGGDAHILAVKNTTTDCNLYELYAAYKSGPIWFAGSGAIWNLNSNAMRPDGWTSADAAGLPILPGLVRYNEVASGRINHALRFTASKIRDTYIWPASHHATCGGISAIDKKVAPMGQRFRLKASYVIPAGFSPQTKVILTALKEYGMILADCGSSWYISGEPHGGWDDDSIVSELRTVTGSQFEAVDESSIQLAPNSYAITP